METIAVILLLALALLWALRELHTAKLKEKHHDGVKKAHREQERKTHEQEAKDLAGTDAAGVIGFLNKLHKDDSRPD